jgi:hypothetical protein
MPYHPAIVLLVQIHQIHQEDRLVGNMLQDQLAQGSVNIRFTGTRHPGFTQHRYRATDGTTILSKGFRPTAYSHGIIAAFTSQAVQGPGQPYRSIYFTCIQLIQVVEISSHPLFISCQCISRQASGPLEQIIKLKLVNFNTHQRLNGVPIIATSIKTFRVLAYAGNAQVA